MAPIYSSKKKASLKAGRPPTAKHKFKKMSSKATQKTIVAFHQLNKDLAKAKAEKDVAKLKIIKTQMENLGGLKAYQAASIQGQSADRGGDSSLVLMKWLEPILGDLRSLTQIEAADPDQGKFSMLEVGALSTKNACSKSGVFDITRIDLNSQAPGIQQQDFMARPLPTHSLDTFDVISLSLVLNFVPSASSRGEMLRRTTAFLRSRETTSLALQDYTGLLFLVLPASCALNSRYFNDERLMLIMASLGYVMLQRKQTAKLVYYLWQLRDEPAAPEKQMFGKEKVRDGPGMNNFYVELAAPE